jgi:phosphotransferase system HPr (HPr) family protein
LTAAGAPLGGYPGFVRRVAGVTEEFEVTVPNKEGLHFRPILQFVDTVTRFGASVTVHCAGRQADGRSPMELLTLVATQGATLKIVATGDDATAAVTALRKLVESGFGEM